MTKLMTLERAKNEIIKLQNYVTLVESYPVDTVEQEIIKEYAITNSIGKVTEKLKIDREFVTNVIKSRGNDELHKLMRSGYMYKTRSNRR
ncbi:hypothetical protein SAMN05444673_2571 [Bacillus sp. OV166]|uniref:hypothetical protein n=1 Tax=Bacillus sp. OV166 TaxID=1882763 RepID=UPI000A2ACC1D|nr:hypothetical protein [Bacillus sp. OV166]SMQ75928.1 hypothetical protein SAMN05444673_2571 [Bacillus sp. OV166]